MVVVVACDWNFPHLAFRFRSHSRLVSCQPPPSLPPLICHSSGRNRTRTALRCLASDSECVSPNKHGLSLSLDRVLGSSSCTLMRYSTSTTFSCAAHFPPPPCLQVIVRAEKTAINFLLPLLELSAVPIGNAGVEIFSATPQEISVVFRFLRRSVP